MAKVKANCCARCSCILLCIVSLVFAMLAGVYFSIYWPLKGAKPGTCTTVDSFLTDEFRARCSCGDGCYRSHDCLIIEVNLDESGPPDKTLVVPTEDNSTKIIHSISGFRNRSIHIGNLTSERSEKTRLLYDDESAFSTGTCTYHPRCENYRTTSQYNDMIAKYKHIYGTPGKVFRCNYHQDYPAKALRRTSDQTVLSYVCLSFGLGIIMCVAILKYLTKKHSPVGFCALIGFFQCCNEMCCECCCNVPDQSEVDLARSSRNENARNQHEMQALNSQNAPSASGVNPTAPPQSNSPTKSPPGNSSQYPPPGQYPPPQPSQYPPSGPYAPQPSQYPPPGQYPLPPYAEPSQYPAPPPYSPSCSNTEPSAPPLPPKV